MSQGGSATLTKGKIALRRLQKSFASPRKTKSDKLNSSLEKYAFKMPKFGWKWGLVNFLDSYGQN